MPPADPEDLVLFHLSVLPEATALRVRGIAQIVAKTLFVMGPLHIGDLVAGTEVLAGRALGDRPALDQAIELLQREGWVRRKEDGAIGLSDRARVQVTNDLAASEARLDSMLERNLPGAIPLEKRRKWFKATAIEFFGRYGSEAAQAVFRGTDVQAAAAFLPDLVATTSKQFGLEGHEAELLNGLRQFLVQPTVQDRELIFSIWQAVFAAQLISARSGVDPITLVQLRDARLYLDTNVLITAVLEAHRNFSSVPTLAKGFAALSLRAATTKGTCDEYLSLVKRKRAQVLQLVRVYPRAVVLKAQDAFVKTAVARGCNTAEDFERFFEEIAAVPTSLGTDIKIDLIEEDPVSQDFNDGTTNTELLDQIAEAWRVERKYEKHTKAVEHDGGLTNTVERARSRGERCWVLTADITMCKLADRRAGPHALPAWVSIYALIELMAFDPNGVGLPPSEFGGLLAAIIENDLQPVLDTYTLQDLDWLQNIRAQAAQLDPVMITTIATAITRMRIRGYSREDPDLRLVVSRLFERGRLAVTRDRDAAVAMLERTEEEYREEIAERRRLEGQLQKETAGRIRRDAWNDFTWRSILYLLGAIIGIGAGIYIIETRTDEFLLFVGQTLAAIGFLQAPVLFARSLQRLRKRLSTAGDAAAAEVVAFRRARKVE